MKARWACATVVMGVMASTGVMAANLEGKGSVTPFIGGYTFDGSQHLRTRPVYGLRLGYGITDAVGVEALFDYTHTEFTKADTHVNAYRYGGDLLYHFLTDGKLVPFVAAGFGATTLDAGRTETNAAFDYGAGVKYFLSDSFQLRGDIRHIMVIDDTNHNLEYTLGLGYLFGGAKPVPAPIAKAEPKPGDEDGDGVYDDRDKCPGTPKNVRVDSKGCPVDSDRDGVPDYLDKCPDSPAGAKVDKDGCPPDGDGDNDGVPDSRDKCPDSPAGAKVDKNGCTPPSEPAKEGDADKDGVVDSKDQCPDTPAGVKVDSKGCPVDSDKDGVYDNVDKCPDTPAGVKVDDKGCPLDSDKDGVYDYLDKCPNTPQGTPVDKDGCSQEKLSITLNVLFDSCKADIKKDFDAEIAKAGDFLKKYPTTKAVIEGHTDSQGDADYNQKLSMKRAEAVRKHLIDKFGIEANRLTAKGYGESKPVASNKTEEGRQKNRRIEAIIDTVIKK